jgi:hypothetical protein
VAAAALVAAVAVLAAVAVAAAGAAVGVVVVVVAAARGGGGCFFTSLFHNLGAALKWQVVTGRAPRGSCFTVYGRSTTVGHPGAVRSHLLEVGQLAIAVGWCYVVCNKESFTRGRARPEGHSLASGGRHQRACSKFSPLRRLTKLGPAQKVARLPVRRRLPGCQVARLPGCQVAKALTHPSSWP